MNICIVCNNSFNSINGLAKHIVKMHHEITKEQYYNTYIKKVSNICCCGKQKKFRNLGEGYRKYCSTQCRSNNIPATKFWLNKKQPQDMIDKRRNTIETKYGVNNGFLSAKTQEWYKGFFCHSNYEKVFIDFCEYFGYTISKPEKIQYEHEGRKRYYYPDFYIEELDCLIEIKSEYTWDLNLELNLSKMISCLSLGYKIEIVDEEYGLLNDWSKLNEYLCTA